MEETTKEGYNRYDFRKESFIPLNIHNEKGGVRDPFQLKFSSEKTTLYQDPSHFFLKFVKTSNLPTQKRKTNLSQYCN